MLKQRLQHLLIYTQSSPRPECHFCRGPYTPGKNTNKIILFRTDDKPTIATLQIPLIGLELQTKARGVFGRTVTFVKGRIRPVETMPARENRLTNDRNASNTLNPSQPQTQ